MLPRNIVNRFYTEQVSELFSEICIHYKILQHAGKSGKNFKIQRTVIRFHRESQHVTFIIEYFFEINSGRKNSSGYSQS